MTFEEELFAKWPRLFRDKARNNIGCPEGWKDIIRDMCESMEPYLARNKKMEIIQIKSKFGELRVYYHDFPSYCAEAVGYATNQTQLTCSDCGQMDVEPSRTPCKDCV